MPNIYQHVLYVIRLATKSLVFLLMSVLMSRHVESRWCFSLATVDQSCLKEVKARLGLNGSEMGGFGGDLKMQDRVALNGCFQEVLRGAHPECIDTNFLSDYYACVFDYSSEVKEKMKAMKRDTRESAWKLGQEFTECLNQRLIPWTEDFWVKNAGDADPNPLSFQAYVGDEIGI